MADELKVEEEQTTIKPDERRAAEPLKQRDDVQRTLRETGGAPAAEVPAPSPTEQVRLWSYLLGLIGLAAFYYLLRLNTLNFPARVLPLISRAVLGAMAAVLVLGISRAMHALVIDPMEDAGAQYNLSRIKQPYRVGDRVRIGDAKGDVIDVSYLDTTLWEFGGEYLSTDHPSGRIIKFPNSVVLKEELQVREQPPVFFRPVENTWIEAIVRYVVPPREAGRIKNRMIAKILERLNAEPDRVKFPKDNLR